MPTRLLRDDLATCAEGIAARLPGAWTSTYTRHPDYHAQIATTSQLWDIGAVGYAASNFVLGHQAVISRANGARLLVFDRPRYPDQFMIGPLEPVAPQDAFHQVDEPNGITVPRDPIRAAAQVTHRLLPRYEQALRQIRHNTAHPHPRRTAPALITGTVSMAWHPDGVVGAVTGIREATMVLCDAGFQYHPYHRQFLLPASYGDLEQIARIQAASQRLASMGVAVAIRPARPAPTPATLPAGPPSLAVTTPAR
ncbi:hypothetical protein ABT083_13270 [Streptomyces goshikiensis]|uniref:hypothetical protein n=1 Tax=Streptomyces goshikiensis TaxID=1942 RepID=UPI003332D15F